MADWTVGFGFRADQKVLDGSVVWMKGRKVIDIWSPNSERQRFLTMFGLSRQAPDGADTAVLSPKDYQALVDRLP